MNKYECVYRVFEPVSIVIVTVGVRHTSFACYVIPTPPPNVMSAIRTSELTVASSLSKERKLRPVFTVRVLLMTMPFNQLMPQLWKHNYDKFTTDVHNTKIVVAFLKELRHGLCILKNVAKIFQVRHLQSVLIFAIVVPFRFILTSLGFDYLSKRLFQGFVLFKAIVYDAKIDSKYRQVAPLNMFKKPCDM